MLTIQDICNVLMFGSLNGKVETHTYTTGRNFNQILDVCTHEIAPGGGFHRPYLVQTAPGGGFHGLPKGEICI